MFHSFTFAIIGIPDAAAQLLQLCLTLGNPIDGHPPGAPVAEILQARPLEWVAISFSNAWKWKVKVKPLSVKSIDSKLKIISCLKQRWNMSLNIKLCKVKEYQWTGHEQPTCEV